MKKILIVDDEGRMRRLYDSVLTQIRYKTFWADHADEANEILKRENIDVALLDINVPGAGGDELYDVIRLFHKDVKVIVSSVLPVTASNNSLWRARRRTMINRRRSIFCSPRSLRPATMRP